MCLLVWVTEKRNHCPDTQYSLINVGAYIQQHDNFVQ